MKNSAASNAQFIPEPIDNNRLANLCGPVDENLRQIAAALDVTIFRRGEKFIADGDNAKRAIEIRAKFYVHADAPVTVEDIQLALVEQRASLAGNPEKPAILTKKPTEEILESPILKTRKADLRGRTPHQIQYLKFYVTSDSRGNNG